MCSSDLLRLLPRASKTAAREELDVSLARAVQVQWLRVADDAGVLHTERALVSVGTTTQKLPERGALLAIALPRLDVDLLRRLAAGTGSGGSGGPGLGLTQFDIKVDEILAFGRALHEVKLTGSPRNERWSADLKSKEITGRFEWAGEGKGRLSGKIAQFALPASASPASAVAGSDLDELPALDLTFDHFVYGERDFGTVKLAAENRGVFWHAVVAVQNADGSLNVEGNWKPSADSPDTQIDSFKLKATSIENMLNRIGYPNAVKRGTATLEGKLNWNGPPFAPHIPSLTGSVKFEAEKGQFNKLEPGVGRLLGVISLQSLPRRITLDFRDVFSEGFAFDRIEGEATIARGVLDTRDLDIRGPAAQVAMKGTADLNLETQNLTVRVQPALGESFATGLLFIHPVTGITTWAVNKLFGRPLDQIFAFEYAITGSWADPKVDKLGGPGKQAAPTESKAP